MKSMKRNRSIHAAIALTLLVFSASQLYAQGNKSGQKKKSSSFTMEETQVEKGENSIYARIFSPDDKKTHPAIIISHGLNGSCTDFTDDANYFAANGFVTCTFDFCGGSKKSLSSGESKNMTLFTEKEDLISVIEYVKNLPNVDKERIYLLGKSQGGMVTALTAEELKEGVKAIALYSPAFSIPDDWRRRYKTEEDIPEEINFWGLTLSKEFFTVARSIDVNEATGKFEGAVLIIHGDLDDKVPLVYTQEAVERYPNARFEMMSGERHGFSPEGAAAARKAVAKFFNDNK